MQRFERTILKQWGWAELTEARDQTIDEFLILQSANTGRPRSTMRSFSRGILAAYVAIALLSPQASAAQATPIALEMGACTVTPRSTAELQELYDQALVLLEAPAKGTPVASPQELYVAEVVAPDAGEPASPEEMAAASKAVAQFDACSYALDLPAITATLTERQAVAYLALQIVIVRSFEKVPLATAIAADEFASVGQFIQSYRAVQTQLGELTPDSEPATSEIQSARVLADHRIQVVVVVVSGQDATPETSLNSFNSYRIMLIPEGDNYLIELGPGLEGE